MKKKHIKRLAYNIAVICLLLAGISYVVARFAHWGDIEWTDNAQVCQHITPVNARIQAFVKEVRFDDYQEVHRGDTLVILEDAEYLLRLAQAEADLERASAGTHVSSAAVQTTAGALQVSDHALVELRVQKENAERELARYEQLLSKGAVTRQQYDNIRTAAESAAARYDQATASRHTTTLAVEEQNRRLTQTHSSVRLAEAALNLARLNLSYCVITATADGRVGKKQVHEGQLVNPGQTLCEIIDGQDLWVEANYRETQLPGIALGAEVEIEADALPGQTLRGTVERISGGTGAAFSLIPTDNATGNFVKIEQRVPVRIRFAAGQDSLLAKLRAGLNVECTVRQ